MNTMNPALDAAIGRRMGLEPEITPFGVGCEFCAEGHSPYWLEDGWMHDYITPCPAEIREIWPPLSSDESLSWRMVEWMREQGWSFEIRTSFFGGGYLATFARCAEVHWYVDENPATAIAHVMAAALGIEVPAEEVRS